MLLVLTLLPLQGFSGGETNFHLCQFLSNFFKYLSSNFLLSQPNNNLAIYFSGSLLLLNSSTLGFIFTFHLSSILFCLLTSTPNLPSNLSTNSFAFSKSFSLSYVSLSTVNSFHLTKYLFTPLIFLLFNILSISHSSTPSTLIGLTFYFLCPPTCSLYHTILLMFTTK